MSKVKDDTKINIVDSEGNQENIYILWYVNDEDGYGVEMMDDYNGLADFIFNDDYDLSGEWYTYVCDAINKNNNIINQIVDLNVEDIIPFMKAHQL
jgi:hypothetical protein